jgi:hypothetical protein
MHFAMSTSEPQFPHHNAPQTFTPQAAFAPLAPGYLQQRAPPFQTCSKTDHMNDIHRFALPKHPNNTAGHLTYTAQIVTWMAANPSGKVNEFQLYPLTPGTLPVASRECWLCGYSGHMSTACTGAKLPALETQWHSIAATIKHHFDYASPANINYVGYKEEWT